MACFLQWRKPWKVHICNIALKQFTKRLVEERKL